MSAVFAGAAVIAATLFPVLPAAAEEPPAPDPVLTSEPTADPTADPTSSPMPTADPTPEATATTEPTPASDPTPTADPTPTSTSAPGVETVSYSGILNRIADETGQPGAPALVLMVDGYGGLLVDASALPQANRGGKITANLAVPPGLVLASTASTRFTQLARYSTSVAPLELVGTSAQRTIQRTTSSLVTQTPAAPATHKIYVVLVSPKEKQTKGANQTSTEAKNLVLHANDYWSDQSGGSIGFSLAGTAPWYASSYSCKTNSGSLALWNQAASVAKSKLGYVQSANTHLVLLFPYNTNCGGAIGLGTIGGSVNQGGMLWVVGGSDQKIRMATLAHELGHNMSLGHADWLECAASSPNAGASAQVYGSAISDPGISGCENNYYGDLVDVMGYGYPGHDGGALSSAAGIRSGIWPSGSWVQAATGTTSYTINSVSSGSGLRSIIIPDPDGTQFFVEYRDFSDEDAQYAAETCYPSPGDGGGDCVGNVAGQAGVRVLRLEPSGYDNGFTLESGYQGLPGYDTYLIGRSVGGVDKVKYLVGDSFYTQGAASGIQVTVTNIDLVNDQATIQVTRSTNANHAGDVYVDSTRYYDRSAYRVGDTLTAFLGDSWDAEAITYQWQRRVHGSLVWSNISSATASSYVLAGDDAGYEIQVVVTGTRLGQSNVTATGALGFYQGTGDYYSVLEGIYLSTDPGTVAVDNSGGSVQAVPSSFPSGTTFTYQWYRGSTAIAGAAGQGEFYTLVSADYNQLIKVSVKATIPGYSNVVTRTSPARNLTIKTTNSGSALTITGTARPGDTLSVTNGLNYVGEGSPLTPTGYSYTWLRNGVAITGVPNASTYLVQSADFGKKITVKVTASKAGWVSVSTTSSTGPTITLTGTLVHNQTPAVLDDPINPLKKSVDANLNDVYASGQPAWLATTIRYQWYRNGVAISGATSKTYTLSQSADYGKKVSVRVQYLRTGYGTYTQYAVTTADTLGNYWLRANPTAPVIVGSPCTNGSCADLTIADRTYFDMRDGGSTIDPSNIVATYQWYRDGVAVTGAAGKLATYHLTGADKGKRITVRMVVKATGYEADLPSISTSAGTQVVGTELLPGSDTAAPTITKLLDKSDDFATVLSFTSAAGDGATGILRPTGTSTANTVKYQWYRDGVAITNATKPTYTLTTADNGHGIKLRIVTSHGAVGSRTFTTDVRFTDEQDYSIAIDPGHEPYQSTNTWTLGSQGGVYGVGQFQYPGGLLMTPPMKYQWLRAGVPIPGATSDTYTIQAADYNKILSVRYIVGKIGYTPLMGVTTGQLIGKGVTLGSADGYTDAEVDIEAGPGVGTLKADVSGLYPPTPTPTYTYKWLRDGQVIPLATASTYKLTSLDYDKDISVRVTMTRTNFEVPVTVLPDAVAVQPTIYQAVVPVAPTIDNMSPKVGQTVTASLPDPSFWDDSARTVPTTGITYVYTWYRSGSVISGATASSYTLVAADLGKKITVRVTATKAGRLGVMAPVSAATATVPAGTIDVGTYEPKTVINLSTRKASVSFVGTPVTTGFTKIYQWYRNGVKITGATASSFVLATTDTNKSISVLVRLTKTGYTTYWYQTIPGMLANGITTASGVVISGGSTPTTATVAQTLTCEPPIYFEADGSMVGGHSGDSTTIQWLRDGVAISGQTAGSYLVVAEDSGHTITCTVTVKAKLHKTYVDTSATPVTIS
ncbi:MAG TPA: zinc-dependent metalloprotease family protein [Pseudolysinimonas sp.]|jgi:hypothetical protein|nr:zinc-dependent metalloprotease family protein [Pseudolysinimonas sp.]